MLPLPAGECELFGVRRDFTPLRLSFGVDGVVTVTIEDVLRRVLLAAGAGVEVAGVVGVVGFAAGGTVVVAVERTSSCLVRSIFVRVANSSATSLYITKGKFKLFCIIIKEKCMNIPEFHTAIPSPEEHVSEESPS